MSKHTFTESSDRAAAATSCVTYVSMRRRSMSISDKTGCAAFTSWNFSIYTSPTYPLKGAMRRESSSSFEAMSKEVLAVV